MTAEISVTGDELTRQFFEQLPRLSWSNDS